MANEVEKVTREVVEKGGILAVLYFNIHAATKDAVRHIGTEFINQILQREGVVYALGEIDEPFGGEEGKNFSAPVQVKILTRDFMTLVSVCMIHSPFNVEVLRPADKIVLEMSQVHEMLGAVSSTAAEYKKYILTKIAKKEDLAKIQENLRQRALMGKKIMEKAKGEKSGS
jgi:hypothetical protein